MFISMKLDKTQRKELAKALYDMGKLVVSALVLGQLIGKILDIAIFIIGVIIFTICFIISTILNKEE